MKSILRAASLAALALVAAACKEKPAAMQTDLSPAQVEAAMKANPDTQLLDVRSKGEWDSGRIKGAKFIPITEFKSHLAEIDKSKPVITYCAAGGRSFQALEILREAGYANTAHLADGIDGWKAAGKPVEK